jgi:GTP cyclohydrolase II/3,4-dihydroxy 2-butanone 4-phosphate synthase/GTP cyclohydrolase II
VEQYAQAELPTKYGVFSLMVFRERHGVQEHVALVHGAVADRDGVPTRVHSECLTGEVFGSLRCDCRDQLDLALRAIAETGFGVVVYLRQEGRGIGLGNKIRAYALQSAGHDTYEANRMLGFPDDARQYGVAADILRLLGVRSIDLITNNPMKVAALVEEGIPVHRRVPATAPVNEHNIAYLRAKRAQGHLIDAKLVEVDPSKGVKAG